jgi:hypothetical protein
MKKLMAVLMTILFLGLTTGLVMAQATGGSPGKHKIHKKGGKGKHKNTLNPQPLPPKTLPPARSNDGAKTAN